MTERRDVRGTPTPTPVSAASDDLLQTAVQLPAAADAPGSGARVGRYVVVESLGAGAMGQVVRAYDPRLRREVALKLLKVRGAEARARIVREAQAMAQQLEMTQHRGVYDVELHEGQPFIAMEYVEGTTLAAVGRAGALARRGAGGVHRGWSRPGGGAPRRGRAPRLQARQRARAARR
ncbi:MAG: protein kinase [Nannocystaceae bacterium]